MRCPKSARLCTKDISKSKVLKTDGLGPLLEMERPKKCTLLWREAHVEVKCTKHVSSGALVGIEISTKCTPLRREAHVQVQSAKNDGYGPLFDVRMSFSVAGAGGFAPCQEQAKREGFVTVSTCLACVGYLKRMCKDAFRVAGAVQVHAD